MRRNSITVTALLTLSTMLIATAVLGMATGGAARIVLLIGSAMLAAAVGGLLAVALRGRHE